MKDTSICGYQLYWHNCYSGTYDLIAPDSVAHPAKMSPALCYKILQHLEELGLIKKGQDTILDPMAGTGMTNLCAGAMGYPSISVELEEKFVNFQKENKEYAERRLYKSLDWTMLKGDSRKLSELLSKDGLKSITSPPYIERHSYADTEREQELVDKLKSDPNSRIGGSRIHQHENSDNPDNIGNLPDKPLKSITSPPYQDSQGHPSLGSVNNDNWGKEGTDIVKRRGLSGEYGEGEGQVGNLKSITSPPYSEAQSGGGIAQKGYTGKKHTPTDLVGNRSYMPEVHGQSEGQIANLKDTPLKSIVSPPYGETGVGDWKTGRAEFQDWVINELKTKGYVEWQGKRYTENEWRAMNHGRIDGRTTKGVHKHPTDGYSDNPDNIGQLADKPLKSIVSPPYGDTEKRDRSIEPHYEKEKDYPRGDHSIDAGYQGSKENIGNLTDKPLKSITSPPYAGGTGHGGTPTELDEQKNITNWVKEQYGQTEGQIENLPDKPLVSITSPPFDDMNHPTNYLGIQKKESCSEYSDDPNNIGNLSDKPLKSVMSPPYEGGGHHKGMLDSWGGKDTPVSDKTKDEHGYGNTEGQIEKSESYLEAMLKVYQEISLVSDVLTVVVKNPTRNGKLRRLDLDTIKILEMAGWDIYCQHRALLFEELEQANMFDGTTKKVKGRLSFFKRLSWQNGNPVASWEDIITCIRR